jgi:hypothetical protein
MSMIKRALAIALTALGLSFVGQGPASAAIVSVPSVATPLSTTAGSSLTPVLYNGACVDLPVVGIGVAFFELLLDDEFDYHCTRHFNGRDYYRNGYGRRAPLK